MLKVAFVVQRYGLEVNGGAELHCRWIAEHMSKYWNVQVLTTCAVDYMTWKNEYNPGIDSINGVAVRRFPVDEQRDIKKFNQFSKIIFGHNNSFEDEITWMKLQGPYSSSLLSHLKEKKDHYDYFIFFTYLYATTFFGLPIVKDKAILVPTAHDEPPIYLKIFDELFNKPVYFIYNSQQEMEFLLRRFKSLKKGKIIGVGINFPDDINGDKFRKKYHLKKDFILFIGRIDMSKRCDELFDFFLRYKKNHKKDIHLVLLGKAQMEIPRSKDIIPLGFVSEQDKFDALDAARLLIVPSPYESLSMASLEAFLTATPVLANGKCKVLIELCRNSHGGLYYTNQSEFSECLDFLLDNNKISKKIGKQGKDYANRNYNWNTIKDKYIEMIKDLTPLHSTIGTIE